MVKNLDRKKVKRKVKRKVNKVATSTVAFILATVTVAFCYNYFKNDTTFFNIKDIVISNNNMYSNDYLIDRADIQIGEKLFDIDRKRVEELLENEVYIKNCKVKYGIPNKIYININERKEKYLITFEDNIIVTDDLGTVLDGNRQNNELFPIESEMNIIYNIGEEIKIDGLSNFSKINGLLDFSETLDDIDKIQKFYIYEKSTIGIDTKYGLHIKMKLDDEMSYNYYFALALIKERLSSNQEVIGCGLDFTKGEGAVFTFGLMKKGDK